MTQAMVPLTENDRIAAVPRWVFAVFVAIVLGVAATDVTVLAVLHREAEHGHVTPAVVAALHAGSYVVLVGLSVWVFRRVAIPRVTAQTRELAAALEHQLELNRRQHDFLVHVHHELRTPVTIILGATKVLAAHGEELDADSRWKLRDAAARNAEALSHLVDDLTRGVDEALPGMASTEHADNWSSTKARRMSE